MITSLDYKPIRLGPLEVRPVAVTASVFSCLTATAQFWISFDGGPFIPLQGGLQVDNRPNLFKEIVLENRSETALTLTFYAGTCAVTYSPVTISTVVTNAMTYLKGYGNRVIAAGQSFEFPGVDGETGRPRRQIVLTNVNTDEAFLYVVDGSGDILAVLMPGDPPFTLEVGGSISLQNPNDGDVHFLSGEIFYA